MDCSETRETRAEMRAHAKRSRVLRDSIRDVELAGPARSHIRVGRQLQPRVLSLTTQHSPIILHLRASSFEHRAIPTMITLDLNASTSDAPARRQLANLSLAVAKCKRIVVVTGAGISCSCGIPV